jgi:hypothetical protein
VQVWKKTGAVDDSNCRTLLVTRTVRALSEHSAQCQVAMLEGIGRALWDNGHPSPEYVIRATDYSTAGD